MQDKFFFADISGFTRTTENFIRKTQYGPEVIRDIVDALFSRAIDNIYGCGGIVLLFAGDGILFRLAEDRMEEIKGKFEESIEEFNRRMSTDLGIKIEILSDSFHPHIIQAEKRDFLYFHPDRSDFSYEEVKEKMNLEYPPVIAEMKSSDSLGELRIIPAGFINIDGETNPDSLKDFFTGVINEADNSSIYVNKIEWADKGWMILVACGLPVSVENAPMRLMKYLSAAIDEAKRRGINAKAGCTLRKGYAGIIGNDKRWEYTFIGGNINLAARIAVKAEPHRIFSDGEFASSLSRQARFERVGEFSFKGISAEVPVFSFEGFEETKSTLFVGREDETKLSLEALSTKSSSLVISGEGGIGKTHFANELVRKLKLPAIYLLCSPKREPFYSAMKIIMESEKLSACFESYESIFLRLARTADIRERMKILLGELEKDSIIVIDDSQYLDHETSEILSWIFFEGASKARFLFIGRDISNLGFTKSKLSKFHSSEISLNGFSESGVGKYLEEATGLKPGEDDVRELARISSGNPLFLSQLISFMQKEEMIEERGGRLGFKSKLSEFPYSLKELILLKFDSFPRITKELVETGSVIGEEFVNSLALNSIGAEAQDSAQALQPAVENRILSRKHEAVSMFYHSIVKQTIFDRMLKKRVDEICVKVGDEMAKKSDNGFVALQAGDFYSSAGSGKAFGMFIKAAETFMREKNSTYFSHSLKRALKEKTGREESLRALRLFPKASQMHIDMELLELAYEKAATEEKNLTKNESDALQAVINGLISMLRDYRRAGRMLEIYREIAGEDYSYFMSRARVEEESEDDMRKAFKTYGEMKKRVKMDKKQEFGYLLSLSSLIFFKTERRNELNRILPKLRSMERSLDDENETMHYYDLMISIYLHTNEIDRAERLAKKYIVLAKKHKKIDTVSSLYNTFAIINSNRFFRTKDKKYESKAISSHRKVYENAKKDMRMKDLPLMVTNLGNAYLASGDAKKCMKCLYEGLLYGQEVDHPIEVPYNMILIMLFIFERGGYSLGYRIADACLDYRYKIDITTSALFVKYFKTGEAKYREEGLNAAKRLLKNTNTPPYQIYLELLFNKSYRELDRKGLSKTEKLVTDFLSKTKLRESSKHRCMMMKSVAEIETGKMNVGKALKTSEKSDAEDFDSLARLQLLLSCGRLLLKTGRKREGAAMMMKSKRIAVKLRYFNYAERVSRELAEAGVAKNKNCSDAEKYAKKMIEMENLRTIEDFALWFQNE